LSGWEWRAVFLPLAFGAGRFGGVAEERLLVGGDVFADGGKRILTKRMDAIATVQIIVPPKLEEYSAEEGAIWKRDDANRNMQDGWSRLDTPEHRDTSFLFHSACEFKPGL